MNNLAALYFPFFLPPADFQHRCSLYFSPLRCLNLSQTADASASYHIKQAAASEDPWRLAESTGGLRFERADWLESGLLSRLHSLLRELENADAETARLFIKGGLGHGYSANDESASTLASYLSGGGAKSCSPSQERLWRDLLLLKLAERQQRSEYELRQALSQTEKQRRAMFGRLRGDEQAVAEEAEPLAGGEAVRMKPAVAARLVEGWLNLARKHPFNRKENDSGGQGGSDAGVSCNRLPGEGFAAERLLVTSEADAFALLVDKLLEEHYQEESRGINIELALPAMPGQEEEFAGKVKTAIESALSLGFCKEAETQLAEIVEFAERGKKNKPEESRPQGQGKDKKRPGRLSIALLPDHRVLVLLD